MKRLFLAIMLLMTCMQGSPLQASGSNTVLFPVGFDDYSLTQAIQDSTFDNSTLLVYLDSADANTMLVARVNSFLYRSISYYAFWGLPVDIAFDRFETVTFYYYPKLQAILGQTVNGQYVVLLPQYVSPSGSSQGHRH